MSFFQMEINADYDPKRRATLNEFALLRFRQLADLDSLDRETGDQLELLFFYAFLKTKLKDKELEPKTANELFRKQVEKVVRELSSKFPYGISFPDFEKEGGEQIVRDPRNMGDEGFQGEPTSIGDLYHDKDIQQVLKAKFLVVSVVFGLKDAFTSMKD